MLSLVKEKSEIFDCTEFEYFFEYEDRRKNKSKDECVYYSGWENLGILGGIFENDLKVLRLNF